MTAYLNTPGLILGGGATASGNGEDDPNGLAQIYQNLLSGAADIVSGLHGKVLDIQAGAIALAGAIESQAGIETPQEVANNLAILGSIAAFCKANGITLQVDADLVNGAKYADGTNALVDQWATAAAAVGLPISSVQDVDEIGASQPSTSFAGFAGIEVNAVQTLIEDYAGSSYTMTAGNLAVGDMEGGNASNVANMSKWWQAYDAAANSAGLHDFSFVTADTGWDAPWVFGECTPVWQGYLKTLSAAAVTNTMSLNIDLQGMETDASSSQYARQTEENAAEVATLAGAGSIVVGNLEIATWQQLPDGVNQITSPTSSTNIAAEVDATYPLYAAGSISAEGPITTTAPGQAIVTTGSATAIVPLSVQWDAADVQAGYRLGVVIIDQTGTLQAIQHGAATVGDPAANILVLSGNAADLAAELNSVVLTEPNSGPDTIDVETFGTAGQMSDNQISVLALQAGQNPNQIDASNNLQGWVSSSAFLNGGSVITSETLYWNTTGTLAGTIAGASPGQSAFVKLDPVHEPLAEYGVENATTIDGTVINAVADVNDPAVDNGGGIAAAGGAANNPGQDITLGLGGWLECGFDPDLPSILLTVQFTTDTFNPVSGQLETSVDSLAPDPLTVVSQFGTAVANSFATQFNAGGTQVVEYNTTGNPGWQAGWGSQFNSVTLTYDGAGKLVEEFLQGGPSNPSFTIDDVFDPGTGKLWEEFQSAAPPPPTSYSYPVPGYATGPLYITEFNTGDNPNWDYLDWGTAIASDTEVRTDYFIMQNMAGFFVSDTISDYDYEFVNGSTLDLLNLPGAINVNLNVLGSVMIDSQTLPSGLSGLTAIDAAGASGSVTLTGLTGGGSTLIGGNATSTITGYGKDTIIAGNGSSIINTGSGGSTIVLAGTSATATINGNNNAVTVATAGNSVTVNGTGDMLTEVAGGTVTDTGASTSLTVNGNCEVWEQANGETVTGGNNLTASAYGNADTLIAGNAATIDLSGSADICNVGTASFVSEYGLGAQATLVSNGVFYQEGTNEIASGGAYTTGWQNGAASRLIAGDYAIDTQMTNTETATLGNYARLMVEATEDVATLLAYGTISVSGNSDSIVAGISTTGTISGNCDTLSADNATTISVIGQSDVVIGLGATMTVDVSAAAVGTDTLTGGSGTNTLVLTSAGTVNLGGVSKFATINLAAGNSSVTVTDTTLSAGSVTIADGSSGNNSVHASTDTSASTGKTLAYFAGSGTDSFTGGFENDTVHVSAAAVAGDTLTGGSGTNTLTLSSTGSVNLGGVSRFGTINLLAGNSSVTVTDKTLSGGTVGIHDGSSGNNSVSAAGDTSASKGKTLTWFTGAGTDSFTGGFENDTVNVTAAAVGGDTLTGGSGINKLALSSAGSVNLGQVSNFGTINLASGNSTVTVTDTTLSGAAVSIYDGSSGNNSVSAAGDTTASKGKTLNYYAGSGKDTFTGGFENDIVHVSAAALAGDTLTGGSGTNVLMLTNSGTANLGGVSNFATIDLFAGNTTVYATAALVSSVVLTGSSNGNTLVLTSAGSLNLGGVSRIGVIDLAAGNNAVTVTDTTLTLSITVNDGASGNNSISAAGDTAASHGKVLTWFAGTGTDSLAGGFENDVVHVSAAAVGGDTLTGGSGVNTLTLSSAGSVALGGVSKFATINLAAGANTVTVTDTTLSGGSVALHAGASGNNTISAAGDTSASTGKALSYFAGPGTDNFTGGFENDTVDVSAAAVGSDTLTGGSGTNTLVLTTNGSVNLAGVSKFGAIDLAAGNSTVTITNTALAIGAVGLHDGASGNETVSAATDTSASTGKTLTYYTGSGTDKFTGGFENDAVHVSAAAVGADTLTGGSGNNALTLSSAGSVNLGGVSKFATVNLLAGNNTVTVTDTTLSGGSVGVHDGASGNNSVSAAGDTSASIGKSLNYFTGAGTDSFTGGFENDTVNVTAAAVGGDTLTGGSGSNKLTLTSAGSVSLGGVSHFGTVALAAGSSTVTVTDTTLSGGSVTINDGASGSNSVSAAGDTSASAGKSLTYVAGSGADSFTGGFENDTIYAGTGLGSYTAGSGNDTFVFIKSSLADQTLNNFQVGSDDILVYGTHSAGGFDLGSTDNPLNPSTPTAIDPSIFIASASGAFTSSTQRFAYDTANGQLHYSATGSNSSESLVATLTGAPAITASNMLFEH